MAAALVFDLTRPETFNSIPKVLPFVSHNIHLLFYRLILQWLSDLRKKVSLPGGQVIPTILLANKGDMTTKNVPEDINDFCTRNQIMAWFVTSAKNNIHIGLNYLKLV